MPQLKAGFILKSQQPNFERDSFETKFEMKNVSVGNMDEGHISYCKEDGRHYTFSIRHEFDNETGFFKLFQSDLTPVYATIDNWEKLSQDNKIRIDELESRVKELEDIINEMINEKYKVTCTLTPNASIVEYTGEEHYVSLSIKIKYKNADLDRSKVTALNVNKVLGDDMVGEYNLHSTNINVTLAPGHGKDHNFNLKVSAEKQDVTATCSIAERSPMFFGWSTNEEPSTEMCVPNNTELFQRKVSKTSLGTHKFGAVGVGYYFWVLIPDKGVTQWEVIKGNGYDIQMQQMNSIMYNNIMYRCYRQPVGSKLSSDKWEIEFK